MSEVDRVEVHHDIAEVDKTDVVHAGDEKNLFVGVVGFGSFLSKYTFPLMTHMKLPTR